MSNEDKEISTDKQGIDATPVAKRAIHIAVGAIAVLLVAIGAFVAWRLSGPAQEQKPAVSVEDRVGVLDIQLLMMAHKEYGGLQELKDEIRALEVDISTEHLNMEFEAPEPDHEAFVQATSQKQKLDEINHYTKLADEVKAKVKAKREEMAEQFEKEVKAVEAKYLNEILSIKLELDNSDVMRLTQEEIDQRNNRVAELQMERGAAVSEIRSAQEAEITEYANELIEEANIKQAQYTDELNAIVEAEELQRETEAQERNARLMDQGAVTPMENAMRIAQKRGELVFKKQQLRALENRIFKEISSLVAKQAIMNQLSLVISSDATNQKGYDYYEYGVGEWHELRTPVIQINTIDLTEPMLQEMKAAGIARQVSSEEEKGD